MLNLTNILLTNILDFIKSKSKYNRNKNSTIEELEFTIHYGNISRFRRFILKNTLVEILLMDTDLHFEYFCIWNVCIGDYHLKNGIIHQELDELTDYIITKDVKFDLGYEDIQKKLMEFKENLQHKKMHYIIQSEFDVKKFSENNDE